MFSAQHMQCYVTEPLISALKVIASNHDSRRARVCLHTSLDCKLQEMLIVFAQGIQLFPLKQNKKSTLSYNVLAGEAELIQLDDRGDIQDVYPLGLKSGQCKIIKISSNIIRTITVQCDYFVFYELAEGPFEDNDTIFYQQYNSVKSIRKESLIKANKAERCLNINCNLKFQVRAATSLDFTLIKQLHHEAMKPHIEHIYGWDEDKQQQIFLDRFDLVNHYLVFDNHCLVGRIKYIKQNEEYFLDVIELAKDYRNKGIGSQLLSAFFNDKHLSLQVYRDSPAVKFYQNCNFVITHETENHIHLTRVTKG